MAAKDVYFEEIMSELEFMNDTDILSGTMQAIKDIMDEAISATVKNNF